MVVETACLRRLEVAMRHSRLKPDYQDSWHHCYNRAVQGVEDEKVRDKRRKRLETALPGLRGDFVLAWT
jgi:hypothetical protein